MYRHCTKGYAFLQGFFTFTAFWRNQYFFDVMLKYIVPIYNFCVLFTKKILTM